MRSMRRSLLLALAGKRVHKGLNNQHPCLTVCFLWMILDKLNQDTYCLPRRHFIWKAVRLGLVLNVISHPHTVIDTQDIAIARTSLEGRCFRGRVGRFSTHRQKHISAVAKVLVLILCPRKRNHEHAQTQCQHPCFAHGGIVVSSVVSLKETSS